MAVLHDYQCKKHGVFESSHPICPHMGCESEDVKIVYLKAPGMMSAKTKNFDRETRNTAESYQLDYLKSAQREGDTSYGGHASGSVLWGDEAAKHYGGVTGLADAAAASVAESRAFAKSHGVPDVSSGMRMAATAVGLTEQVMPRTVVSYSDKGGK
jgi:hypothetical protein